MEQIVYISTSRTDIDPPLIDKILAAARRNNERDGLTGLLIAGNRRFLQVLEGPGETCLPCYDRIRADPRHFAIVQLSRRTTTSRSFGDWTMGFEQEGDEPLSEVVDRLTRHVDDATLQAHLRSFAELHSKAA